MSRRIAILFGSVCLFASLITVGIAQEAKEAKPSTKAKGRLPAYYKDVVTPTQKETIYALQAKYGEQIRKLAEEMKAVTAQRDQEIEALLSAEQKAKVEALKAASKQKPAPPETTTAETAGDEASAASKDASKTTATKPASK